MVLLTDAGPRMAMRAVLLGMLVLVTQTVAEGKENGPFKLPGTSDPLPPYDENDGTGKPSEQSRGG